MTYNPRSSFYEPNASDLALWKTAEPRLKDGNAIVLIVSDLQDKKSFKRFLVQVKELTCTRCSLTGKNVLSC